MLAINLRSAFIVTQLVIDMIAAGWGQVINISSSARVGRGPYGALFLVEGRHDRADRTLAQGSAAQHHRQRHPARFVHNGDVAGKLRAAG
jgi:NAD(P)-dependent dehydrogenase (short-subunit alcohol dehydrogenase family)